VGRRAFAASLAALAESGIVFLFVMEVAAEATRATGGPLLRYPLFVALFVGAVAVGSLLRGNRVHASVVGAVAVALGLAQGLRWGNGDALGTGFLAVIMLLAALRVVTLVRRNWQDPVAGAFLAGALLLLLEVILAPSAQPLWRHLIPVVVVVFFAGSLASRAASVMVVEEAGPSGRGSGRAALPVLFLVAFGCVLVLAEELGGQGGILQRVGAPAHGVVVAVLTGLGFLTATLLLGPASWLLHLFHFSLEPLRTMADRLRALGQTWSSGHGLGPAWLDRMLGLLLLAAICVLLMRMIRRRLAALERAAEPPPARPREESAERSPWPRVSVRLPFLRRELPADTVRRWYAEALVALERRGLDKPAAATPAEYLGDVVRAFPVSRSSFGALTRAYEDVRYGSLGVDRTILRRLEDGRAAMMETFRRAARADEATLRVGDPGP